MKLYTRNTTVDVMRVDNVYYQNFRTENTPMNRNVVKLHRGVDNEIRFRILNQDRKPVDVDHLEIIAVMTDPESGERVLTKILGNSPRKGFAQLRVNEGDLIDVAPGYYNLVILGQQDLVPGQPEEVSRTPFYTDIGDNIVCTVEVLASADPGPRPSYTVTPDDWRLLQVPSGIAGAIDEYRTSAIPAGRVRDHRNGLHTVAVFTSGFSGTLQVMATLDLQPPEDPRRWFPVDLTTGTNLIEFDNYTGSTTFTFTANFTWITFIKRPGWWPEDSVFRNQQQGMVALPGQEATGPAPIPNTALDFVFDDITNPGGYETAANLMRLNRNFLQTEIREWIAQRFPGLMTPEQEDLCDRDVGLMVDGIATDLQLGGFGEARRAAEAYFNEGDLILPPGQESPTAQSYVRLGELAADIIRNISVQDTTVDRVLTRFTSVSNPGGFTAAAQLLRENREFFKADIKAWVKTRFPNLMSITQAYLCDRDVGLIVDALARDLETGGFAETRRAADEYFRDGNPVLPTGQNSPTAQTYLQLLRLAESVIRNQTVFNTPERGNPLPTPIMRLPAQDPVEQFFAGTVNPGGYNAAADLLVAERTNLQNTIEAWVAANFPGLLTPELEELCRRDVGTIVDSIVDDLRAGGYAESKRSAEYYFQAGNLVLPPGQKSPTSQSFEELVNEIDLLFSGDAGVDETVVTPVVQALVTGITDTIRDPFRGSVERFFPAVTNPGGFVDAVDLISRNRAFLQAEAREWVAQQFPGLMTPAQEALCDRDVGFILDSLEQDLIDGGILGSKLSAGFYFNWGDPVLPADQASPSAQTFERVAVLIESVIRNTALTPLQALEPQVIDLGVTVVDPVAVDTAVSGLIEGITNTIREPFPSPIPARFAGIVNPGGYNEAAAALRDNRVFLQETVRAWVTEQFPDLMTPEQADLCDRDVGLIVDGLALDLENGGAAEAIRAGESYWAGGDLVLPVVQKSPTAQTFDRLAETIAQIMEATLTTDDPVEVDGVVTQLIDGVNSIIRDPFQNPLAPAFTDIGFPLAAKLLKRNREFLKSEVREWVEQTYPGLMTTWQADLCDRDVGTIIDGLAKDLETGSAHESLRAAQSYFNAGMGVLPERQENPSAQTFLKLVELATDVLQNTPVPPTQPDNPQLIRPGLLSPRIADVLSVVDHLVAGVNAVLTQPNQVGLTFAGIINPGNFNEAALLLATSRSTLQSTVRAWVETQYPDLLTQNQADLCDRDVGIIIDSLIGDLRDGGTNGALRSALAYYNNGVPVLPTGQQSPTARSFEFLLSEIETLFAGGLSTDDPAVVTPIVAALIDGINRVIRNPFIDPGRVTLAFTGINNAGGFTESAGVLQANRAAIQSDVRAWVSANYPGLLTSTQSDLCDRDVGLIVDALTTDLGDGGVAGMRLAALSYYNNGNPVLPTGQQSPTAASFRYLATVIETLLTASLTLEDPAEVSGVVQELVDALNQVIIDPFRDPTTLLFDNYRAAELLSLNRAFLQAEVRSWVELNYPGFLNPAQADLCDRDVGIVVDGFIQDLIQGGFTQSLRAAESYFNWGNPVLPSPQGPPSAASFLYLSTLCELVIGNQAITPTQPDQTQVIRPSITVDNVDVIAAQIDSYVQGINSAILSPPTLDIPFVRQVFRPAVVESSPEAADTVMNSLITALNSVIQDPPFIQVKTSSPEPLAEDAQAVIDAHIEAVNRVIVTPPVAPIISNDVVRPFFENINNPGGYSAAADLIMANFDFLKAELREWVGRVFPNLMTDRQRDLCIRDVGLIIESLARPENAAKPRGDLRAGGFAETLRSAQAYFNQGTPLLPVGQESPTARTYEHLAELLSAIIRNQPIVNPEQAGVPQKLNGMIAVPNPAEVDGVIGALIDRLNSVIRTPPVPQTIDVDNSAVAPLFLGLDNPGGFDEAANIIATNRASLQSSVRSWVKQEYPGLMNSQQEALCDRDVGLIIDALARPAGGALRPGDLRVGGFQESLRAAEAYFNNGAPVLPGDQESPSAASFSYLVERINLLLESGISNDIVRDRFLNINNLGGFDGVALIAANRSQLKFAVKQWVRLVFPSLMTPEQEALCDRDVGLIIDALVRDLREGGYQETLRAAQAYFNNGSAILPTGQLSPTAQTFDYLVTRIEGLLTSGTPDDLVRPRFESVNNPGGFGSIANTIVSARDGLKTVVRNWVATNYPGLMTPAQEELCDRDVGLIIDALVSDLRSGSFVASLEAADAYYNGGSPVLPVSQNSPTAATFEQLVVEISSLNALQSDEDLEEATRVMEELVAAINSVITNPPTPPGAPSNVTRVAETVETAQALVDVLNGVIRNPPSVASPPQIENLTEIKIVIATLVGAINNVIKSPPIPEESTGEITKIILR